MYLWFEIPIMNADGNNGQNSKNLEITAGSIWQQIKYAKTLERSENLAVCFWLVVLVKRG
jgi:hypothetical protein